MGGKFHLKLNIYGRPIAHKYRKGKVKRTLKRESKVLETAQSNGIRTVGSGRHFFSTSCTNVVASGELDGFRMHAYAMDC